MRSMRMLLSLSSCGPLFSVLKPCSAFSRVYTRDIYGDHVVSCAGIISTKHRHNVVRDTLINICFRSKISAGKEVDIGFDGSSPLTQTGMVDFMVGRAVTDATHHKRILYETKCSDIRYGFLPFLFFSLGELQKDAVALVKRIMKFSVTQDIRAHLAAHIFNRISFAIAKGNTLAEYMIPSGVDNRPPMLDKDLYDSWKSIMELYMQNIEHVIMILKSVKHGLPDDIYSLVNHHGVAKDLWERVQLLMQDTSLTKQERECKLYDAFDKSAHIKGESLNNLLLEWSKFVTDVKLVKDLHNTNYDQLHAYLEQHELHANEVQACPQQPSIPQIESTVSTTNQQTNLAEFPQIDFGLAVPVFKQGDDPIDAINKMMSFLSTVITSRFLSTNNQLRNSSNPRQQVTIHDGRVTIQPLQGRPNSYGAGTSGIRANTLGTEANYLGQQRVVKCFNCQREGHMARQCLKLKRKKDATWFMDKVL
ncbi:integrase, catalytic region, zinc finger, CCHC-type containing protein [Tanacetum coccineum]